MCAEKDFSALELAGCLQIHHNIKASVKNGDSVSIARRLKKP
jgi:hypothetical protein